MLKITLALIGLSLSLTSNAAIVTHGSLETDDTTDYITDTATGRQYTRFNAFDKTYAETLVLVSAGGTYEGWSIANAAIADEFIESALGTASACTGSTASGQVCGYIAGWLDGDFGDSHYAAHDYFAYLNAGIPNPTNPIGVGRITPFTIPTVRGLAQDYQAWGDAEWLDYHNGYTAINLLLYTETSEVPIPAAGWLFMSALVGLAGKKRLSRRYAG